MTDDRPTTSIGIIGCGNISRRYVEGMRRFPQLRIAGCADVVPAAAASLASEAGIRAYDDIGALLADDDIETVVSITPPAVHADVAIAALRAGKHVYTEKPIATTLEDADRMIAAAGEAGRLLGSAPDTFLGSAGQTARAAVDEGLVGEPIAATAFITHSRAERWHPDPTFLFTPGGGPLLDLGPYYVTALVNLLGPVHSVSGATRIGSPVRRVTAPGRRVDDIAVTTPTHASATLTFHGGQIATVVASFDVWNSRLPRIEVYGTEATLSLPDPNQFDGPVSISRNDDDTAAWTELAPVLPPSGVPDGPEQFLRGMGVADLVAARGGAPLRVGAELGRHVLEVLDAVERSSASGERIGIASRPGRPAPRPAA